MLLASHVGTSTSSWANPLHTENNHIRRSHIRAIRIRSHIPVPSRRKAIQTPNLILSRTHPKTGTQNPIRILDNGSHRTKNARTRQNGGRQRVLRRDAPLHRVAYCFNQRACVGRTLRFPRALLDRFLRAQLRLGDHG